MEDLVLESEQIMELLSAEEVKEAFAGAYEHVGNAPQKCQDFLNDWLYPTIGGKS